MNFLGIALIVAKHTVPYQSVSQSGIQQLLGPGSPFDQIAVIHDCW